MPFDPLYLSIQIRIEQRGPRGGAKGNGITMSEETELDNLQLVELAQIIQQFHDMLEAFKRARHNRALVAIPSQASPNKSP